MEQQGRIVEDSFRGDAEALAVSPYGRATPPRACQQSRRAVGLIHVDLLLGVLRGLGQLVLPSAIAFPSGSATDRHDTPGLLGRLRHEADAALVQLAAIVQQAGNEERNPRVAPHQHPGILVYGGWMPIRVPSMKNSAPNDPCFPSGRASRSR